jgi:hypothetical protein
VIHTLARGLTIATLIATSIPAACGDYARAKEATFRPKTVSGPAAGTKVVTITDYVLNMTAYSLTVPSNWIFDGTIVEGSSCVALPFAVFRATSPDGLTGLKSLPRLDWAWSDNPNYANSGTSDCLQLKRELTAEEVLQYMVGVLQVEFVESEQNPNLEIFQHNISAHNTPSLSAHGDQARAIVRYHINKIVIEERLDVSLVCNTSVLALLGRTHSCSAYVTRMHAPQGKWSEEVFKPIGSSLVIDQHWNQRWTDLMIKNINDNGRRVLQAGEDAQRLRNAQNSAFQQAQQMRQQQHEEFDASMQRGTDKSMQAAAASANARSRAADDWCDYSLDQQKRLDPNTGFITKDSSAYNYSWVNEQGDRVQTNNINANPNGNGSGNWTLQENVH